VPEAKRSGAPDGAGVDRGYLANTFRRLWTAAGPVGDLWPERRTAMPEVVTKDAMLALLRAERPALERFGVRRAALFGSVARGDAHARSDVDVLVVLDPEAHVGLIRFIDLQQRLRTLFGREVDLVSRGGLRTDRDAAILEQAVWAF